MILKRMIWWVLGQLPQRKLPPNPKTNPNLDPNPNRGEIFLGGNYPDIDMVSGAIVWTPIYLFIYFHFILS